MTACFDITFMLYETGKVSSFTYIIVGFISMTYNQVWDIYLDWGLLSTNESGKQFLR